MLGLPADRQSDKTNQVRLRKHLRLKATGTDPDPLKQPGKGSGDASDASANLTKSATSNWGSLRETRERDGKRTSSRGMAARMHTGFGPHSKMAGILGITEAHFHQLQLLLANESNTTGPSGSSDGSGRIGMGLVLMLTLGVDGVFKLVGEVGSQGIVSRSGGEDRAGEDAGGGSSGKDGCEGEAHVWSVRLRLRLW